MELDERNIQRILCFLMRKLKKNKWHYLKCFCSTLYLIFGFAGILYFLKNSLADCNYPIGALFVIGITILLYLAYFLINHMLIKNVFRHSILLLIETLLLVSILIIM